ncbi:MAG: hypothetical protein AAFY26_27300 [Cyanobacteria bacterium J06638_22]
MKAWVKLLDDDRWVGDRPQTFASDGKSDRPTLPMQELILPLRMSRD